MEEILTFLDDVLHNNNRPWFQEHKKQYQTAQANFNALADQIIAGVQKFDDNCKGLTLKDCTYRFYRDTRFSPDKRPYKTHFGVFVCPEGKKSMLSGYYFHLEAKESEYLGHNMLCTGMYMPDTTMLKTIRDEILFNRAQRLSQGPPAGRTLQATRLARCARPPRQASLRPAPRRLGAERVREDEGLLPMVK